MTGLDWLPCDLERMTGPEWLRIPAVLRGHWHALWCWCGSRRNGGRIEDCRSFTNRDWDRIAGVTKAALRKLVEAGLVSWDGDDLIVSFYPVDAESKARSRSRAQNPRLSDAGRLLRAGPKKPTPTLQDHR